MGEKKKCLKLKNESMRNLILILFISLCSFISYGQYVLKLTNTRNNKEIIIKEGSRVAFVDRTFIKTGIINKISDTTVVIKDIEYNLSDFKRIGERKKGTSLISFIMLGLSGYAIGYSLSTIQFSDEPKPLGLLIGISLFGIMQYNEGLNKICTINKTWKLSIDVL